MSALQQALLMVSGTRPESPPSDFSGLTLWIDAGDASKLFNASGDGSPVSVDGTAVGVAASQASIGNCLAQATNANRPLYKTAIANGRSVLRFDGSNDLLQTSALSGSSTVGALNASSIFVSTTSRTLIAGFAIAAADATTGTTGTCDCAVFLGESFNPFGIYATALDASNINVLGALTQASPNSVKTLSEPVAKNTFVVVTLKHDGSTFYMRINGGTWQSEACTTSAGATTAGRVGSPQNAAKFLQFDLGQLAVYNTALSDGDITLAENYIANAMGIAY